MDLGFIANPWIYSATSTQVSEDIGRLVRSRSLVRRRQDNSLLWEEPTTNERLYNRDAILTLAQSSATLMLKGDIQLQIQENTLVVLEPPEEQKEQGLRLRFHHGDMRGLNRGQKFRVGTGEWTLNAAPGSDVSLRSLENEQVEVEVHQGQIDLNHQSTGQAKTIEHGQRLKLESNTISDLQTLSEKLVWDQQLPRRVYSHRFPITYNLRWLSDVEQIRWIQPDHKIQNLKVDPGQREFALSLEPGVHALSLEAHGEVSPTISVQILSAPVIRYFSPLPRDRVRQGKPVLFAWQQLDFASHYRFEILDQQQLPQIKQNTNAHQLSIAVEQRGSFLWQVYIFDEDGFEIPPKLSYPIFSDPDPFAAPKLRPLQMRSPAQSPSPQSPQPPPPNGAWLEKLWHWLLPSAYAEDVPSQAKQEAANEQEHVLLLSWYAVPGADFYIIEISESPGFEDTVVNQKVYATNFRWNAFSKQIYYYRVAAGDNDGRMGLFTEPERLDLTQVQMNLSSTELQPGVHFQIQPKKIPVKVESRKELKTKATPTTQAERSSSEEKSAPTQTPPSSSHWSMKALDISFSWDPLLIYQEQRAEDSTKTVLRSQSPLSGGVKLKLPLLQALDWNIRAQYTQIEWKPVNSLVFQKTLQEQRWYFDTFFAPKNQRWQWGAVFERRALAQRTDSEQVELRDAWSTELAGRYTGSLLDKSQSFYLLSAGWLDKGLLVRGRGDVIWNLTGEASPSVQFGAYVNVIYWHENDRHFLEGLFGIQFILGNF